MDSTGEQLDGQRRRFLSAVGATGVGGLLAGCVDQLDPTSGDTTDDESNDEPDDDGTGSDDAEPDDGTDDGADDGTDDGADDSDPDNGGDPEPAVFEILSVSPEELTAAAVYGERLDLTATIRNAAETEGTQSVTLSVDGDERESISLELDSDAEGTVEFAGIHAFDLTPGTSYTATVSTENDEATVPLEIESREWPASVGLETVATGFDDRPVAIETAPGSDRLYIVDRTVGVLVYENGELRDEPVLDLSDDLVTADREDGVMGLEFHPEFEDNRRCFVSYTAEVREGTPDDYHNTGVVAEFEVGEDGLSADRASERTVIEIPSPDRWHNTTSIDFGPDGYLYIATGDGGSAGDPGNDAQSVENLLGSITRIDVDGEPTEHHRTDPNAPDEPEGETGYAIPEDNPLVGQEGSDELYAWGLRSPWGVHFDGEDYYVADVGQGSWEEVNLVEKGGNYGWNVKEGTHCYQSGDCPDSTPDGEPLLDPIIEYPRDLGICVVGGVVYHGDAIPGLDGRYVFGELIEGDRLFVGIPSETEDELWDISAISIRAEDAGKVGQVLAFAEDADGELLVMANHGDAGNSVHRVVPVE